ncbi:MAG: hypothetical protein Q8O67_19485 [Deltaproteobacteria bacterium]|nr:hypothetical protein [Deltaproteobacteria bacterium]
MRRLLLVPLASVVGCLVAEPPPAPEPTLFEAVTISVVADASDGLRGPRDLDFNPEVEGELWIVNRTDDSTVTISELGTTAQTSLQRQDPYALHFMEETSSISFSTGQKFGTCGESRNTYNGFESANDFMGPTLWSADPAIFAVTNPEAVVDNGGADLGSHLDMMHETPLCMGIAWVDANVFFVFEGLTGTIARYDFKTDHGPGFDFHGDGTVERFVDVDVVRVADVPSHMVYDASTELLYVADTGNARVAVLDVSTALQLRQFGGFETLVQESEGAGWTELVVGADADLQAPSGLALKDGVLYVADNLTSRISAFDLEGNLLETLDLDIEEGGLMGIRVSPDGDSLYAVDFVGERVLRIEGLGTAPSAGP